jgi:pyridoxal phosphate enzyme, YggS family
MIKENLNNIISELPSTVKLVAVSKFHPVEEIKIAYDCGQRIFGENRPQELAAKVSLLPSDIQWHFIGHLQTNKIKYVVPHAFLIHSVDSDKLLYEIDKYAESHNIKVKCLLEVFIATEITKHGFSPEEIISLLNYLIEHPLKNTDIYGLMGMASFVDDANQIKCEFLKLKNLYDKIKLEYSNYFPNFNELSMGMSNDYKIAIECGSTLVRIGTSIFGPRQY